MRFALAVKRMKPTDIRIVGEKELLITWEDGERSLYAAPYLQISCRCARCVNEITGEQIIQESQIDPDATIREVVPVGGYAVRFRWSSGCTSGIFSFEYLYSIRPNSTRK